MKNLASLSLWNIVPFIGSLFFLVSTTDADATSSSASHTSNHAVIVSSSRYWFNYRHTTNALSIYELLKRNNIPDANIVLMVADEYAVNDRNVFKNKLLTKGRSGASLYNHDTQISYRGDDVTVDNFVRVLLGRNDNNLPVLQSDATSHVLVYMTGHGGDQFFKFQDKEEITSMQLARTFRRMHELGKYQELLFVADTCQAFTLADHVQLAPNVTVVASSLKGESSYAHHSDGDLGLSVTERYTAALVDFLTAKQESNQQLTLKQGLVDPYPYSVQRAHIGFTDATAVRKVDQVLVNDFFGHVEMKEATSEDDAWAFHAPKTAVHRFTTPESTRNGVYRRRMERRHDKAPTNGIVNEGPIDQAFPGMESADPIFVTWVAVFVGAIALARRRI